MIEKTQTIKSLLASDSVKSRLHEILGKNVSAFTTSVIQIATQNSMLSKAEPSSILNAAMTATTLNLPINNAIGHAYIVPFNERQKDNSYKTKAQFILGYKGLKQLAIRSGQFQTLYAKEVYEGQKIEDDSFLGYKFDWSKKENDTIIGYASYFKLTNGFESLYYMDKKDLEKHGKKFSQTFKKGFGLWKDEFDKMAIKTITKLHLNSGEAPLSIEMQTAIKVDQAVINDMDAEDVTYVDNIAPPIDTEASQLRENIEKLSKVLDKTTTIEEIDELELQIGGENELKEMLESKRKELSK